MSDQELMNAAADLGFTADKSGACGIYDKYLVSFFSENGNKAMYINYLVADEESAEMTNLEISQSLKDVMSEYSLISYEVNDGGLTVIADCPIPLFLKLLDYCIEMLDKYTLFGCDHCTSCGCEFGDRPVKKIHKGNKNYISCESCALEAIEVYNKTTARKEPPTREQKSKALLLSLAAGIVGIVLYVLVYSLILPLFSTDGGFDIRYIICILGFVISLMVYFSYTAIIKTDERSSYITVGVVSIIASALGQYAGTVAYLISTVGGGKFPPPVNIYLMPLRSTSVEGFTNYSSPFYIMLAVSLLFAACGSVIFLLGLYENNHKPKEEMGVETVTKIG